MLFRFFRFTLALILGPLLYAGYPAVETAGFHHAALIYRLDSRRAMDFMPMIARYDFVSGKFRPEKVFDCFIFLNQHLDGIRTDGGKTDLAAWQKQIDLFFHPDREVNALEQAAAELQATFGGQLPQPLKVMFYIPYLHPDVRAFGDVDGDGRKENASSPADIEKIIRWYTGEIAGRMEQCPHLQLLGFYWMKENVDRDAALLEVVSRTLRNDHYKFLWIPWFRAENWDNWRQFGFDCAIMQSNYAFTSPLSGGTSRSNRLDVCAELCRSRGLGVEIEFPYQRNRAGADIIRRTYDAGSRHGFQKAPGVWFFSTVFDEWKSPQPEVRAIYDWTCDYISGKDMRLPEEYRWRWHRSASATVAEITWDHPRNISCIDVFLDEEPSAAWRGIVEATGKTTADASWKPLSWIVRGAASEGNGRFQNITLLVHARVSALKLTFHSETDTPAPSVLRIGIDDNLPASAVSKVYRRPYDCTLPEADYAYPDLSDGRKLLDGRKGGAWQNHLGWNNAPIGLLFDLGENPPLCDEIRVYARQEPAGAIHLPNNLSVASTDRADLRHLFGMRSAAPEQIEILKAEQFSVTGRTSDRSIREGFWSYRPAKAAPARYYIITGEAQGWSFLSEVEFLHQGKRLDHAPFSYRITAPLQRRAGCLNDDRGMLTDGRIEPGIPERYVLLPAGEKARIGFSFDHPETVSQVKVYSGEHNPAFAAPLSAVLELNGRETGINIDRANGILTMRLPVPAAAKTLGIILQAGSKPVQLTEVTVE